MNTTPIRLMAAGAFFLLVFLSGFWLSHSGRPFNGILLTVHKLIALAAAVLLATAIYQIHRASPLTTPVLLACALTALFFLGTIVTGGLLSAGNTMPAFVHTLHRLTPYLTILSASSTLYLLYPRITQIARGF